MVKSGKVQFKPQNRTTKTLEKHKYHMTTSNTNAASNAPSPNHLPDFAGKDGEMIWRKKQRPVSLSWCSPSGKNRDGVERWCSKPGEGGRESSQWCPMSFTLNENCIMINQGDRRRYRNNLLTLSYVLTFHRPATVVLAAGDTEVRKYWPTAVHPPLWRPCRLLGRRKDGPTTWVLTWSPFRALPRLPNGS